MTIVVTNWQMHVTRLDTSVDGKQQPIPWLYGSNASVSIDLAPARREPATPSGIE
jgi:hypothetical protein